MIDKIGETAGLVWKYLEENGDTSIPQLSKNLKSDDFLVTAALGWLAREDKIQVFVKGRSKAVRLK
jgi:hypothetical protein